MLPVLVFVGSTFLSLTLMASAQNPAFVVIGFAGAAWMTVALVREIRLMMSRVDAETPPGQTNIVE